MVFKENDDGMIINDDGSEVAKGTEQARINTLTKNWRTTERALEDANKGREDDRKLMHEMGEHTKKLTDTVETLTKTHVDNKEHDAVKEIEDKIAGVDRDIASASEAEEWGKVAMLQGDARRLERDLNKLENKPVDTAAIVKEVKADVTANTPNTTFMNQVENFTRDNKWYRENKKMRRYADNLSAELLSDNTGKYKTDQAMLDEVKKQTEEEFKYKPPKEFNSVEPGGYGNPVITNPDDITGLTPEQKKMSDDMGISHENMLKSVKAIAVGRVK